MCVCYLTHTYAGYAHTHHIYKVYCCYMWHCLRARTLSKNERKGAEQKLCGRNTQNQKYIVNSLESIRRHRIGERTTWAAGYMVVRLCVCVCVCAYVFRINIFLLPFLSVFNAIPFQFQCTIPATKTIRFSVDKCRVHLPWSWSIVGTVCDA